MTSRIKISLVTVLVLICSPVVWGKETALKTEQQEGQAKSLPFPKKFDPVRYLGKWYEVARLPAASQPKGTLATAEYSKGVQENEVIVKNTAYDANGKPIATIQGKAKLLEGDPPRLAVSFGPIVPKEANYYVMHVDKKYQHAVVGTPDRKSLWVLARKVPVAEKKMKRLMSIAKKAKFDTKKLIVNQWNSPKEDKPVTDDYKLSAKEISGVWDYVSGERDGQKLTKEHFRGSHVEVTKDTITLNGELIFVLNYKLEADKKHASVKLDIKEGPFGKGSKATGIMKLDGKKLMICYHPMGGATPTKFEAKEGSGHFMFVLSRRIENK